MCLKLFKHINKKNKKNFKKVLTNNKKCAIINTENKERGKIKNGKN